MGFYLPNLEIPKGGYVTLEIHSDGSVIKTRECKGGVLRIMSQRMDDAVNMDDQKKKKSA